MATKFLNGEWDDEMGQENSEPVEVLPGQLPLFPDPQLELQLTERQAQKWDWVTSLGTAERVDLKREERIRCRFGPVHPWLQPGCREFGPFGRFAVGSQGNCVGSGVPTFRLVRPRDEGNDRGE